VCTGRAGSDPRPRTTVPGRTQTEHHRPRTREASGEGCIYSSSVRVRSSGQRGRVPVRLRVRERRVMSPTGYHARRHQDAAAVSSVSGSPQPRSEGAHRTTTGRVNRGAWVRPGSGGGGPPPARRPARGAPARRHVRDRPRRGRHIFSTNFLDIFFSLSEAPFIVIPAAQFSASVARPNIGPPAAVPPAVAVHGNVVNASLYNMVRASLSTSTGVRAGPARAGRSAVVGGLALPHAPRPRRVRGARARLHVASAFTTKIQRTDTPLVTQDIHMARLDQPRQIPVNVPS